MNSGTFTPTGDLTKGIKNKGENVTPIDKNKKKEKVFPENTIWAKSEGQLLDKEFHRLIEEKNLSIQNALLEIGENESYRKYWDDSDPTSCKPFRLSDRAIHNAYDRHVKKQRLRAFEHIKTTLLYDGVTQLINAVATLQTLITPVLVNPKQAEVVAFGIAHWMWQVKRRIYGLEVDNHLVIGFINEGMDGDGQGSGKTTFAKNICKPFTQKADHKYEPYLYADTDLETLSDKKAWADILGRPIAFLDDISPESKQEVATLKSIFTCNGTKSARGCYEKGLTSTEVLVSAIFTCNSESFGEVIKDVTGSRRYLPIQVLDFKGKIDKNIDFIPFWKMIDHTQECFTDMRMFREMQQEHMTKNSLELLLDQYDVKPGRNKMDSRCVAAKDVKLVLNKIFPKEKNFSTTQSVTKQMKKMVYLTTDRAGQNSDQIGYFMKFKGNSWERWEENFPRKTEIQVASHSKIP